MKRPKYMFNLLGCVVVLPFVALAVVVISPWFLYDYYLDSRCPQVKHNWPCKGANCEIECLRTKKGIVHGTTRT